MSGDGTGARADWLQSNLDESGVSEFELRLRQVDDVLSAAQRMFDANASEAGSVGGGADGSRMRDLDTYLASKGVNPNPALAPAAGTSPGSEDPLNLAHKKPLDLSRVPPDRAVASAPTTDVRVTTTQGLRDVKAAPAPAVPFTGPAPNLRANPDDDSLSSTLPMRFGSFLDDYGRDAHASVLGTSSLAAPAPAPAAAVSRYHSVTVHAAAWRELSSRLRDAGVPGINVQSLLGSPTEGTVDEREVLESVHQLLSALSARARDIQDLSQSFHDASMRSAGGQASAASAAKLQRQLEAEQQRRREEQDKFARATREVDDKLKQFQQQLIDSKQKLAYSEHRVKRREAELEELRSRLSSNTAAQRDAEVRAKKLLSPARDTIDARRAGVSPDAKSVDAVIMSFEKQRDDMAAEIGFLRAECERLHDIVRRNENTIATLKAQSMDDSRVSTLSERRERAALDQAQQRCDERQRHLHQREQQLNREMARWEAAVEFSQAKCKELTAQLDAAKLELDNRPTSRDYREAIRRVRELEREVTAAVEPVSPQQQQFRNRSLSRSSYTDRKHYGTGHLVAADKAFHKRVVQGMVELGTTTITDIIRDLCLELGVKNPDSISSAVRKLKRAVEAIPPMEAFIQRVADLVIAGQRDRVGTVASSSGVGLSTLLSASRRDEGAGVWSADVLDNCIMELQSWGSEIRERDSAKRLRHSIQLELRKRIGSSSDVFTGDLSLAHADMSDEDLLTCFRRILRSESQSAKHRAAYAAAEAELLANGAGGVLPGIVAHFGKLFDVKKLEGMFPRMNELYLFVNEMKNFTTVLKDLLDLDAHVSTNSLLVAIREAVGREDKRVMHRTKRGDEDDLVSIDSRSDDASRALDMSHVVMGASRGRGEPPSVTYSGRGSHGKAYTKATHVPVGVTSARDDGVGLNPLHEDEIVGATGVNPDEVAAGVESSQWIMQDDF